MLNLVTLQGRISKDLELKFAKNSKGEDFATLNGIIAVGSRKKKDSEGKPKTYFIPFKAVGKTAEVIQTYIKKGDALNLIGEFAIDTWKKEDDSYASFTYLDVDSFAFSDGNAKKNNSESNENNQPVDDGFYPINEPIDDEDRDGLPF